MVEWKCCSCGKGNDAVFARCHACGTGQDGTPPPPDFASESASQCSLDPVAARALDCLRCSAPMRSAGRRHLHTGTRTPAMLLGEFGVDREPYDIYHCTACGKVELFLPQ